MAAPDDLKAHVYALEIEQFRSASLVHIPCESSLPLAERHGMYNIAMVDVSASMHEIWPYVLNCWNTHVAPVLFGRTDIYTFGSEVKLRRHDKFLQDADNDCTSTNLTEALKVVREKVCSCQEKHVRVFLITDGGHNYNSREPPEEIELMEAPKGKTVEVYLLGVGLSFPVQYSIDIRSRLHNGAANCPTIFWCQEESENDSMNREMMNIADEMKKGLFKVKLSIPAQIIPLVDESKTIAYGDEFLFYEMSPEDIRNELIIKTEQDEIIPISGVDHELSADLLVNTIFKQWNAILIQRHRKKLSVPMKIFDTMKMLFHRELEKLDKLPDDSVKSRVAAKQQKQVVTQFSTLMNQSFKIISLENEFKSEIELANAVLNSAVQSKYDSKILQLRGHKDSDWNEDVEKFKKIYLSLKDKIMVLDSNDTENCCRVLLCSFLADLQDKNFFDILEMNKMDFLSTMTFTGIPVYAPVKDAAQINPYALVFKNICNSPFEILSQRAMESSLAIKNTNMSSDDKEIILQQDNPNSKFNIIVPIIPKEHCEILKPLVLSNVFAVGASFCILKNPLILDDRCHFAALACTFIRSICEHDISSRPDYVKKRIEDVTATARLYLDRKSLQNYLSALMENPKLALMTEATEEYNGHILKCETLIKPTFLMYLCKEKFLAMPNARTKFLELIKMILVEFLGRCLSSNTLTNPFMTYLINEETNNFNDWLEHLSNDVLKKLNVSGKMLLEKCYYPREARKFAQESVKGVVNEITGDGMFTISPNLKKLVRLRHSGSAGHIGWEDLKKWAFELAQPGNTDTQIVTRDDIETLFSNEMISCYLLHALNYRKSSARFAEPLLNCDKSLKAIDSCIKKEIEPFVKTNLLPKVLEEVVSKWQTEFDACHKDVAIPLTKAQIIEKAQTLGIDVSEETFEKVYKYRPHVGLCRNCCQVEKCPYFLKPDRRFNCHLEAERKTANEFPHTLHLAVSQHFSDQSKCIEEVSQGTLTGTNKRMKYDNPSMPEDCLKKHITDLSHIYQTFSGST